MMSNSIDYTVVYRLARLNLKYTGNRHCTIWNVEIRCIIEFFHKISSDI